MTTPRPPSQGDDTPLNPADVEDDNFASELAGDQPEGDQVAYFRQNEISSGDGEFLDVELDEGDPNAGIAALTRGDTAGLEDLAAREMRDGETDNPDVAAEEGLTWVPPVDPPVVPDLDDPQGAKVAAGFGSSADDEPYDSSHRSGLLTNEDDMEARIREALLADAATSGYAELLVIGTRGGTVAVRGLVDDIDDTDNVVEVISRVSGVDEVIDELEVRGVTD